MDEAAALGRIRAEMSDQFIERDAVVEATLSALVARHHVLVVGPPGTAKSMLAEEVCRRVEGARYFSWLLTKFTTPEELFGAVSLSALERDEYLRVTTGKLPEAHVAFLDEVFKASSAILNALLTILNERRFHNAGRPVEVPLLFLVGATNEIPDDEDLLALYDRFLVRFVVDYIQEEFRFLKMLTTGPTRARTLVALEDLDALSARAKEVRLTEVVLRDLAALRAALRDKEIVASDRRWRQSLDLLRAHAVLDGRDSVSDHDLPLLEHVLWSDPEDRAEVGLAVAEIVRGQESEAQRLLFQARELLAYATQAKWPDEAAAARASLEARMKISRLLERIEGLALRRRARGGDVEAIERVRVEVQQGLAFLAKVLGE